MNPRPPSPTLANSSVIMTAFMVASMALRYGFLVTASWLLAPNEYGLLGVSLAILTVGGLLFSPFPLALTKYVSEGRGHIAFKSVVVSNVLMALVFGLIIFLGYYSGALHVDARYRSLIILVIIASTLSAIGGIYEGALKGQLRFRQLGMIRVLDQLLIFAGMILVALGWGVNGALLGVVIAFSVATALLWYNARDPHPSPGGRWWEPSVQAYGWPMLVGGASAYLLMNLDIIGLKLWGGKEADTLAGQYQAVQVLARMPLIVILGTVLEAYFPFIARHSADKEKVEAYVNRMVKYALVFCIPMGLALALVPRQLLGLMFPQTYQAGAPALSVLAVATLLLVFVFIISRTLQAAIGPGAPALALLGAAVVQMGLLYTLAPRHGLLGAATATATASLFALIGLTWTYTRQFKVTLARRSLPALAIASALLVLLLVLLPTSNATLFVAVLALAGLSFFVTLVFFRGVDEEDADLMLSGVLAANSRTKSGILRVVRTLNRTTSATHA